MLFKNRSDAGRQLSRLLERFRADDVVVLGLPRGGVPVAYEVAKALAAPLDVILVRKLGVPFQSELAMGAIGEDGVRVVNDEVVAMAGITEADLERVEARERLELERRRARFRSGRARLDLSGRTAIVVDDGIATGSTARAACQVARAHGATRVILAAPVASPRTIDSLLPYADEVVCLDTPEWFFGIGQFYADFAQVPDEVVTDLLDVLAGFPPSGTVPAGSRAANARIDPPARDTEVEVRVGATTLPGRLTLPSGFQAVVLFAHGSGSSRHSPRNRFVAEVLQEAGLGTLLFDLLTVEEEASRSKVFDIALLADRLAGATRWLRAQPDMARAAFGYFGASTGAGAALWAAGEPDADVAAVVSRGGRPDLAAPRLGSVRAPTLLVVGGLDDVVLALNREAYAGLRCERRLEVVPGATHLFEEPGTLATAAGLARDWFIGHLAAPVAL
ncbi:MAG TPA: phosphoribosyltransferase family protein [Acidimicrobiales bacterium]|nr:phosphoribosyltransferase family protein [Acidimicrobiales bacterium]